MLTGERIQDTNCPLKVFESAAIKSIPYFDGFHRFIPTLLRINGYRVGFVEVTHHRRRHGKSKYNVRNRLFKGLSDIFGVLWIRKNYLDIKDYEEL